MSQDDQPQIYLATPESLSLSEFPSLLGRVLDAVEIACIRVDLASSDEDVLSRAADALREVAHARDVAIVLRDHWLLAERLGLDGVHLRDGAHQVRAARKALGPDAIVGTFCGTSRHDGISAGESGADYVSFGPVGQTSLGNGETAPDELFAWWSEMIELPVVAEGALDAAAITRLAPVTDFFCIGPEIWTAEDPAAALTALTAPLR